MKTITIRTPENIDIEYRLATLGSRAAAVIIDMLIQASVIGLIYLMLALIGISATRVMFNSSWVNAILLLIAAFVYYGYFVIFEMTMNGKTPGKKLYKLRVIRKNGQPITLKHSLVRNLFRIFIDTYGIGVILIFFTKNYTRVGDLTASTIVVAEDKVDVISSMGSTNDINELEGNNEYPLDEEEYTLLMEYFLRKDKLNTNAHSLKRKMIMYFATKFNITIESENQEKFLEEIASANGIKYSSHINS